MASNDWLPPGWTEDMLETATDEQWDALTEEVSYFPFPLPTRPSAAARPSFLFVTASSLFHLPALFRVQFLATQI
jgi:hypothetical protein